MEAKDLRIGNKFLFYKSMVHEPLLGTVTSIDNYEGEYKIWIPEFSKDIMLPITALKPIELTEDWLLKMGFDDMVNGLYIDSEQIVLRKVIGGYSFEIFQGKSTLIQYVHQLQNLYYALTNTELTINL